MHKCDKSDRQHDAHLGQYSIGTTVYCIRRNAHLRMEASSNWIWATIVTALIARAPSLHEWESRWWNQAQSQLVSVQRFL